MCVGKFGILASTPTLPLFVYALIGMFLINLPRVETAPPRSAQQYGIGLAWMLSLFFAKTTLSHGTDMPMPGIERYFIIACSFPKHMLILRVLGF